MMNSRRLSAGDVINLVFSSCDMLKKLQLGTLYELSAGGPYSQQSVFFVFVFCFFCGYQF